MITIKQHIGRLPSGHKVPKAFDAVLWDDAGTVRKVAYVGHKADAPIVWITRSVPESVQAKIVDAVEKRKHERAKANQRSRGGTSIEADTGKPDK